MSVTLHASHPEIVKRLKRAAGHLNGVIAMIEGGRDCLALAQQLHAVEAAVAGAKRALIHDHIDHCLDSGVAAGAVDARAMLKELKALSKHL